MPSLRCGRAALARFRGAGLVFGPDLSEDLAGEIGLVNEAHGNYRMMPVGHEVLEGRSDQAPFQERGVLAVHLATGIPPRSHGSAARAILDSWLDKKPETEEEWASFTDTMAVVAAPFAALLL